ncbi:winged helix DNA-binding domain-containing protein [Nonomuraea sp. NBC_01738]|uniref:winged helix DNA-binding domain-containing protein n=1 Tax=Nonomuraea sp. NBC_01738 TaxID=2976003 RepID=UPI002E102881|nr:winged helix DNA-binding domain-containing protein [Nonomuraea sp. NBC_01738]
MRSGMAQLLHRPDGFGVGEVVRWLGAVQAQDTAAAALAFRARMAGVTPADIDAAVERREIVRAWGPRNTLHYVHRDDLGWLLALTSRRLGSMRRLREEGVEGDDLLELITGALDGQGPLTKAELEERLGGRARGQGVVHLVSLAAARGLAVLGPDRGRKPTYVHTADWLGAPIRFEPDLGRALGELALRYARSHRPAEPADFAAWSGLSLGEARKMWINPEKWQEEPPITRLLPAFDEILLGWKSRDPILPAEHARTIFPGGGILRPAVFTDGRVTGTWSRKATTITVTPFDGTQRIPPAELDDVTRFLTQVAASR